MPIDEIFTRHARYAIADELILRVTRRYAMPLRRARCQMPSRCHAAHAMMRYFIDDDERLIQRDI